MTTERPLPLHPVPAGPAGPVPNAWAGGRQVLVPGVGGGRIVSHVDGVRVVEARLPAPAAAVFLVDDADAPVVVLTDPRVEPEHLERTVAAARLLVAGEDDETAHVPSQRHTESTPPPAAGSTRERGVSRVSRSALLAIGLALGSEFGVAACSIVT